MSHARQRRRDGSHARRVRAGRGRCPAARRRGVLGGQAGCDGPPDRERAAGPRPAQAEARLRPARTRLDACRVRLRVELRAHRLARALPDRERCRRHRGAGRGVRRESPVRRPHARPRGGLRRAGRRVVPRELPGGLHVSRAVAVRLRHDPDGADDHARGDQDRRLPRPESVVRGASRREPRPLPRRSRQSVPHKPGRRKRRLSRGWGTSSGSTAGGCRGRRCTT